MPTNTIPIVFSSSDNYAPYLGVCIKSLIEHSSPENYYEIFIINEDISEKHKNQIISMQTKNILIQFVDIKPFLENIALNIFTVKLHFTITTYYKFFLQKIFTNYDKLVFLDCDIVILRDIKELLNIDIGDNYFGVTRDMYVIYSLVQNKTAEYNYYHNVLGLENHENYFNAGCLICNIKKMKEDNLTERLIDKLCEIKHPRFADQCILNAVCQKKVKYIPSNWNYTWHISFIDDYELYLPSPYIEQYLDAKNNPYIIHFTSGKKPWLNPSLPKSDIWWGYARRTPFYEEILYRCFLQQQFNIQQLRDAINYKENYLRYWRYKILSKITLGKTHKKYNEKRKAYKEKLHQARKFLGK
jgi:lipopolysaccharide biosynthesis glycosyltransferase